MSSSTDTLRGVVDNRRERWRIHFGLLLAELICVPAFLFEITRAAGGNTLSWAYVFEWPLFGGYAVYMWRQLLRQENGERFRRQRDVPDDPTADARLAEWNDYLSRVHGRDDERAKDAFESR